MYKPTTKTLFIVIQQKWFNEIKAGRKLEEYRDITPYWTTRIEGREYENIIFQAGYRKDSDRMTVKYNGYYKKQITHVHFNNKPVNVYALKLGEILN